MARNMFSDAARQSSPRQRLTRLALASLMAFGIIGGFAANASAQEDATGNVAINAEITPSITLTIDTPSINFGSITPWMTATLPAGVTRVVNENVGTYFVSPEVTVTVNSNVAWTGTVTRTDGASPAINTSGKIYLHQTDAPDAVDDFTTADQVDTDTEWASVTQLGNQSYTHYLSLYVPWNQAPGTVNTTVTYTVAATV